MKIYIAKKFDCFQEKKKNETENKCCKISKNDFF